MGDTGEVVGKVLHYYDKAGVAVVKLEQSLKVGDAVKFVKGEKEFEQTIESMQLDHKPVEQGEKGAEVAVKVNQETKRGTRVYSVA